MKKWLTKEIEDYGGFTSPSYKEFERDYRSALKKICKNIGANLHSFGHRHYDFSAVIERNGKYAYFSISDVRYFKNEWYNNILVRSMAHDKDWTGGSNCYCNYAGIGQALDEILTYGCTKRGW